MPILPFTSVVDTSLWNRLKNGFAGDDEKISQVIAADLQTICTEASDRMRGFPFLHPEYTLHDQVHLLRVTELMSSILSETVANHLNPLEIMLLILAAHFHDQGMVLERSEIDALEQNPAFLIFRDTWEIEHPNLKEVRQRLRDRSLSDSELLRCRETEHDLRAALLTDHIRTTHGERSAKFVRDRYSADPRWTVSGTNVAELVARLCQSHVQRAADLTAAKGFRVDEVVGIYRVNMPYLGLLLRLADILDFDRDRTPDSLYRTINFRSDVSLREWGKHRSVTGWVIEPTLVQFTMLCEHPEYQRAAYQFMDWIDAELAGSQAVCRNFPANAREYTIDLPLSVDRSRIEPKDNAYIYYDLEFSLSRDEVVKLLMMDGLYGGSWLCVRELLQNSLDALRHRKALIRSQGQMKWSDGNIEMTHEIDAAGHEVVRCTDNGIGMDRSIVERFLTNAGRSYYRSPEFEQERASFREAGVDFDPCAQFGIGFMSCFMLGDRITIKTRRDYGPARGYGEPLVIEILGLGGIVVIRTGHQDQPVGTTVEIVGRKKPGLLDRWTDQVRLIAVLDGYALATEFPIKGHCTVPELAEEIEVPLEIATPTSALENIGVLSVLAYSQPFSEIDSRLNGFLRSSFLVNDDGRLVLENSEAKWEQAEPGRAVTDSESKSHLTKLGNPTGQVIERRIHHENQTCLDGILVAGEPGRKASLRSERLLGSHGNPIHAYDLCNFILDIRGPIKPPLTPARFPTKESRDFFGKDPQWDLIQSLVYQAEGELWEKIINRFDDVPDQETLWSLALIYGFSFYWMSARTIWSKISVPIVHETGQHQWRKISSLDAVDSLIVPAVNAHNDPTFRLEHGDGRIGAYESLSKWASSNMQAIPDWTQKSLVAAMGTVALRGSDAYIALRFPDLPETRPGEFLLRSGLGRSLFALPYSGECRNYLSVHMACRCVNRADPLVREALNGQYLKQKNTAQAFASAAVVCFSDPKTVAFVINPAKPIDRWRKSIGSLYSEVEWVQYSEALKPPYRLRTSDGSDLEITHEVLLHWANADFSEKSDW